MRQFQRFMDKESSLVTRIGKIALAVLAYPFLGALALLGVGLNELHLRMRNNFCKKWAMEVIAKEEQGEHVLNLDGAVHFPSPKSVGTTEEREIAKEKLAETFDRGVKEGLFAVWVSVNNMDQTVVKYHCDFHVPAHVVRLPSITPSYKIT